MNFSTSLRTLAIGLAVLLAACASPDSYYSLSADGPVPTTISGVSIGVGPVSIPDYVDRAELVFQSEEHRFQIPFEHRWAGSLQETTTRVLGTNLARRLNTGNLHLHPWEPKINLQYEVPVQIRQFHAVSGDDAILEASWTIKDGDSGKVIASGVVNASEPIVGDGYDAVVAAESRLVAQLADAIAARFPKT